MLNECQKVELQNIINMMPPAMYGSPASDFSDVLQKDFQIMWNRSVRRILHLPYATHTIVII